MASILRSHLFEDQLPLIQNADEEQIKLLEYLKLARTALTESDYIGAWFTEFGKFMSLHQRSAMITQKLLFSNMNMGVVWSQPKLITLPCEYKDVFQVSSFSLAVAL